jgi:ABC-type oligopeptide transport system substrate-binding subunit
MHKRAEKLAAAESLLLDDSPIAPLYFYVSKHLVSSRVRNFKDNVLDRHPTRFLRLQTPAH